MNNEIKEILDRLERIDHKEYSGGFEFADSSTFNEMCRCYEERKKMADYITNLEQKYQDAINQSIEDHKYASKKEDEALDYKSRTEKAVEYCGLHTRLSAKDLLNILRGDDK